MTKIKLVHELGVLSELEDKTNVALAELIKEGNTVVDVKCDVTPSGGLFRGTATIIYEKLNNKA